jgi:hypothetical protein
MADQRYPADDAVLTRIGQAVMLHLGGDREEARCRYLRLWTEMGDAGDQFHRCTLAHFVAATHDDPVDALAWDLRALSAAGDLAARPHGARHALHAFAPSLHLSLAADYGKLGRLDAARSHVRRARRATRTLGDDGYGITIRAAISRLEDRLARR